MLCAPANAPGVPLLGAASPRRAEEHDDRIQVVCYSGDWLPFVVDACAPSPQAHAACSLRVPLGNSS